MNLRPLHDNIVVIPEEEPLITEGGIYLPEEHDEGLQVQEWGIVIAVGPGRRTKRGVRLEPQVSRGDRVAYGKHHHIPIRMEKTWVKIVPEREIWVREPAPKLIA